MIPDDAFSQLFWSDDNVGAKTKTAKNIKQFTVGRRENGFCLRLTIQLSHTQIEAASFQVYGNAQAIVSCQQFVRAIIGKELGTLSEDSVITVTEVESDRVLIHSTLNAAIQRLRDINISLKENHNV